MILAHRRKREELSFGAVVTIVSERFLMSIHRRLLRLFLVCVLASWCHMYIQSYVSNINVLSCFALNKVHTRCSFLTSGWRRRLVSRAAPLRTRKSSSTFYSPTSPSTGPRSRESQTSGSQTGGVAVRSRFEATSRTGTGRCMVGV